MALLSSKGVYGLCAMYELSQNKEEKPMQTKEIAKLTKISQNYLEQLLILLRRAELIRSIRGAYGGYVLAKSPNEITIKEILVALEGSVEAFDIEVKNGAVALFLEKSNEDIEQIFDLPLSKLDDFRDMAYGQINYEI